MNPDHLTPHFLGPEIPEITTVEGHFLVSWFFELHGARGGTFGPDPLKWSEILAWSTLTRRELTIWNLTLLRLFDGLYMKSVAEQMEEEAKKKK